MKDRRIIIVLVAVIVLAIIAVVNACTLETSSVVYKCEVETHNCTYAVSATYEHKSVTVLHFNEKEYALFTDSGLFADCMGCSDVTIKIVYNRNMFNRYFRDKYVIVYTDGKAHTVKPVLLGGTY